MEKRIIEDNLSYSAHLKIDGIHTFRELDSTNSEAMRILESGRNGIQLVVANLQTDGRGRRGRRWLSPKEQGLYMSLLHPFTCDVSALQALSLVSALSVHESLTGKNVPSLQLKWPNDLLIGKKKLAGILLELRTFDGVTYIIFGIGVNYSLGESQKSKIDRPVTDLAEMVSDIPGREEMVGTICSTLLMNIEKFIAEGFGSFQDSWNQYDFYYKSNVVITNGNHCQSGKSLGVNKDGALVLETSEGEKIISAGELLPSLKGAEESFG